MHKQNISITVKPKVMEWAIDSSGLEIDELSKKSQIKNTVLEKWKRDPYKIKISQLEKLSKTIKRPLPIFLLEEPPQETEIIEYRKISKKTSTKLTSKTMMEIRNARYLQSIAEELMSIQKLNLKPKINTKVTIQDNPEKIAEIERKKIYNKNEDSELNNLKINEFYNRLKEIIESFNIFIFQASMPINEIRGLTLSNKFPQIIVINSKDTIPARIFSLLHEYAHVLLRKKGICSPITEYQEKLSNKSSENIEKWCNNFAASFLMPKKLFLNDFLKMTNNNEDSMKIIAKLSSKYRTSKQSTIIRIKNLDQSEHDDWQKIYNKIIKQEDIKNQRKTQSTGSPSMVSKCISKKGKKFISLILNSKRNEDITNCDLINYLDINFRYVKELEEKVY